jgi:hypothetical protein
MVRMSNVFALTIAPGNELEGSDLSLFVRREHVAEVLGALREAGFSAEEPISHSADPDSVQITIAAIGAAAGTLTALAVVLEKILSRHDRKRLVVNQDGVDAMGYSAKDLNQILSALIEDEQREDSEES